ncbi:aldehyde dehydrogenase family protein [Caproiciproducens sp. R1]|uniref:aldehyde dehydrogenase family protein n=1 Tax=Caproiciproducens sp. R1 TaxID=3435000 RepID=UPI00403381C5
MKMLIGGKKVDSRDKRTIDVINPATGAFLDTIPMATREDVDEAVENSKKGQKEWAAIPLLQREKIIHQFLRLLEEHKREIISVCTRECGKHVGTTIFEFNQTPTLFSGYMESAKRMDGKLLVPGTELGHDGKTAQDLIMVLHEPLGTVAAIVPFNAPMLLYSFKVAPALAAGNSVIVKPPTDNPLTDIMITELLLEAGVPGNTVQIVTGSGSKVGNWLVQNPGVDAVSMTGSTEVGVGIAGIMAKRLAPYTLELGGNDPFIVLDDVDVGKVAKQACGSRKGNTGQICIASKRFLVQNSIREEFTEKLLANVRRIECGFDDDFEQTMEQYFSNVDRTNTANEKIGSLISVEAAKRVEEQVRHTIEQGANLECGGVRNGAFFEPTVLTNVTKDMDVARDMEIFGPVWPIIGFDTVDEAVEIANASSFGLSGCVMTNDWKLGMYVAQRVQSGGVVVNGSSVYRNQMQPFGGQKMSGIGNEGFTTLEELTKVKNIVLKGFLA